MASPANSGPFILASLPTLGFGAGAVARGQHVFDHTLPSNLPFDATTDVIADRTAIAFSGAGSIHVLSGLPLALTHTVVTPVGPNAMAGGFRRLHGALALYRAAGADLTPGTADDPLHFVSGLPAAPVIKASTAMGLDLAFVHIN
jgi:hypothetical protein